MYTKIMLEIFPPCCGSVMLLRNNTDAGLSSNSPTDPFLFTVTTSSEQIGMLILPLFGLLGAHKCLE